MFTALKNITIASAILAGLAFFPADLGLAGKKSDGPELEQSRMSLFSGVRLPSIHDTYFEGRSRVGPNLAKATMFTPIQVAIDTSPMPAPQKFEIAGNAVNLRNGPANGNVVIGKLTKGDVVTHLGVTDGRWLKVAVNETSDVAWLHESVVKPYEPTLVMAQN